MKKIALLTAAAAIMASCAQPVELETPVIPETPGTETGGMTFTALTEAGTPTKTDLQKLPEGPYEVRWSAGDKIGIYDGLTNNEFVLASGEGTASGTFTGKTEEASAYLAVYPYDQNTVFEGNTVTAVIPEQQTAKEGTIGDGYNIAVAKTTDKTLNFKNVCSVISFKPSQDLPECTYLTIQGLAGEFISGDIQIDFSGELPAASIVNGKPAVRLNLPEGGLRAVDYFCSILPQNFVEGFRLAFYDKDNQLLCDIENATAAEAKRSHVLAFGEIPVRKKVTETLYLIGDATPNAWSADNATEMQRVEDGVFTWTGKLNVGEFKFITTLKQFLPSYNKAADGKLVYRTKDEEPDEKFRIDEFNTYKIDVNLYELTISIGKVAGGDTLPEELYLVSQSSEWAFEAMYKDVADPYLFRIGKVFPAGEGDAFKFGTVLNQMTGMYKPAEADAPYTNTATVFVSGTDPDNNWTLKKEECGKAYKICFDIRTGEERMMMREFTPYEAIYMVGSATPKGWNLGNATPLQRSPDSPYIFTWTGTLKAGEMKFSCDKQGDWNGAWFMSAKPDMAPSAEVQRMLFLHKSDDAFKNQYKNSAIVDNDYKWKVQTEGTYTITLNQLEETISIAQQ